MEYIILQGDAKPSNYWVADYIEISEAWEAVSKEMRGEISGLITPYGMDLEISIDLETNGKLHLSVKKHLENTKSGSALDVKPWPFSQVLEAKIRPLNSLKKSNILLERNKISNRLLSFFKGFKKGTILDGFILYSDNLEAQNLTGIKELIQFEGFGKLSVDKSGFLVKFYSLPIGEKGNFELIQLIKKLNKNIC